MEQFVYEGLGKEKCLRVKVLSYIKPERDV